MKIKKSLLLVFFFLTGCSLLPAQIIMPGSDTTQNQKKQTAPEPDKNPNTNTVTAKDSVTEKKTPVSIVKTVTAPQNPKAIAPKTNVGLSSLGFGLGMDYGGLIGLNLTVYPLKNVGLFGAAGYALIGVGYNVGLKLRWVPQNEYYKVCPFAEIMYGYNAVIKVTNADQYNKMFYGITWAAGLDFKRGDGGWSLAFLVPLRGPEVANYENDLQKNHNVKITQQLLPFAFSVGYKVYFN
ncbi:MAG TPA: hypothetical protein VNZ49_00645 [Bacteroidia bacterium]|jgi:hypothetical protein|nr:hypothetical protein [Bacteroidia bacterium]